MTFYSLKLLRVLKNVRVQKVNLLAMSSNYSTKLEISKKVIETKNREDLKFYGDPDTFGTLSKRFTDNDIPEDDGDVKEENFLQNRPLSSQKLTIKQYSDIIKQYLKIKRLKEAIDVLEVRMLKEDRVKPENYIYNILIGGCADVGYTRKAFQLFNDMKRRGLKPTGDTYTCLFVACANSPWKVDGLKNAHHLRELMQVKQIEPNLTNYNAMIKAFGRCGDLLTAFKVIDEMTSKKIKIRNHTFNHLLHACISDRNNGLRHALVVWRKMLSMREKPNIYSFNLMLRCVRDCNLESTKDVQDVIRITEHTLLTENHKPTILIGSKSSVNTMPDLHNLPDKLLEGSTRETKLKEHTSEYLNDKPNSEINNLPVTEVPNTEVRILEFTNKLPEVIRVKRQPNLLSKTPQMSDVLSLQEVNSVQEKFALIGGQEDFLKEMAVYSVKPDIKTFTQMLDLIDNNEEAEQKLLETVKSSEIFADIDFYNMLIKKRCLRNDYDGANEVMNIIEKENKLRRKKHPAKKKLKLKPNVMTYGVLAMACKTKEDGIKFLDNMKEKQLKINIEILGTLLRHATVKNNFGYIVHLLKTAKEENLKVNQVFIKHLEKFNDKCTHLLSEDDEGHKKVNSKIFRKSFSGYMVFYKNWLKDMNVEESLQSNNPWAQFKENYPEPIQRENVKIVIPKKFYKRNRKFVKFPV